MNTAEFELQTKEIFYYFFHDDAERIETDSSPNEADPVKIAEQLRKLGDHYDETVIQPLIKDMQKAAGQKVSLTSAFSNSVESLSKVWEQQTPEVATEKYLLKATMAVALYIKKNCPDITQNVERAAVEFVSNRLARWIFAQGGWEQASSL